MTSASLRSFPGSPRLLIARDAGRAGRHIRSLAGSSSWHRDLVDRVGALAVLTAGPTRLPAAAGWSWPEIGCAELTERLRSDLPGLRLLGAVIPRQPGRERLSLLGRSAGTLAIIKLGVDGAESPDGSLEAEAAALSLLEADPLPGISTPRLIAHGVVADTDVEFIATTSVAVGAQRAAIDAPLRTFEADLGSRLSRLARPADTPTAAVPIHGDLTPWNLRRTRRGLALFDWESAGWGPPGTDLATYRIACDEVRPFWRRRPDLRQQRDER